MFRKVNDEWTYKYHGTRILEFKVRLSMDETGYIHASVREPSGRVVAVSVAYLRKVMDNGPRFGKVRPFYRAEFITTPLTSTLWFNTISDAVYAVSNNAIEKARGRAFA